MYWPILNFSEEGTGKRILEKIQLIKEPFLIKFVLVEPQFGHGSPILTPFYSLCDRSQGPERRLESEQSGKNDLMLFFKFRALIYR
jgi:hypothetical protein